MATAAENLASSLQALKKIQDAGKVGIKTTDLSRTNRERLLKNGFLKEVLKGWYITTPSNEQPGDTSSWYASYWGFCADYLQDRYADDYFLSPDQSLQIHAGNWTVPPQLIIRTSRGVNHNTPLLFDTSLWNWQSPVPEAAGFVIVNGLRMMDLPSSLVYCTNTVFTQNAADTRIALAMIAGASEINSLLLAGGHSTIAGKLAAAFRNIGKEKIADDIIKTMQSVGYAVREANPFSTKGPGSFLATERSPYINRIKQLWYEMRETVMAVFPKAPGLPANKEEYQKQVEDIYTTDAYHSLSIERYQVTAQLIEKVKDGSWDFHKSEEDKQQRDAMAARGYWQAAQKVRATISKILNGANAGKATDADYGDWYRELFAPSVQAGIIVPADLAGFRNKSVIISGSRHTPMSKEAVRETMPVLFELLQQETEASVRAVLGHFIFVYIHPYADGNGRIGRFLMNVMLASGGYPWTVIPVTLRKEYMEALEQASTERNIEPFAKFVAYLVGETMKGRPVAR
jgi:hypothetical protein